MEIHDLTQDDLSNVANIHILAFPDAPLSLLGKEAIRRYYLWQMNGPHDSSCLGAYLNKSMVGFCFAGIFHGAESGFILNNKFFLLWRLFTHPGLLFEKSVRFRLKEAVQVFRDAVMQRMIKNNPPSSQNMRETKPKEFKKDFGVLSIAVHPDKQGLGVGKALMDAAEKVARNKAYTKMHLTVHTDNYQAIKFYENYGWTKIPVGKDIAWQGHMLKIL